jgi:TonB family protein
MKGPTHISMVVALCIGGCATREPNATYGAAPPTGQARPMAEYRRTWTGGAEQQAPIYKALAAAVDVQNLDGPITPLAIPPPDYPEHLQMRGIQGIVEIVFLVNEDGRTESAVVERSVHPGLDAECLKAIRRWRFAPMTSGGKPVKVRMLQRFPFLL